MGFSALRNVPEQVTIALQLSLSNDAKSFRDWRNGDEKIKFGWAADLLSSNSAVVILEKHLKTTAFLNQCPNLLKTRSLICGRSKATVDRLAPIW